MSSTRIGSEAGASLIEVLVAVTIMGVIFVAVLGGLTTAILASDMHRKQATAETLLRSFAETVKGGTYDADCDYSAPVDPDYPHSITCEEESPGLQRIELEVKSSDERAIETVEILKRDPS